MNLETNLSQSIGSVSVVLFFLGLFFNIVYKNYKDFLNLPYPNQSQIEQVNRFRTRIYEIIGQIVGTLLFLVTLELILIPTAIMIVQNSRFSLHDPNLLFSLFILMVAVGAVTGLLILFFLYKVINKIVTKS